MRYLILSDIHSNKDALDAVMESAEDKNYDEICCLGDVVGYGAEPNEVTDWVRENVPYVIRGNHDKTCCGLEEATSFNAVARLAVEWTLQTLTPENRDYLFKLAQGPMTHNGFLMAHGSVADEDEYVVDPYDALMQFPHVDGRLVFFGHTHLQGGFILWAEDGQLGYEPIGPSQTTIETTPGRSYLINPGSVGQPRDLDWKAAYAVFDSEQQRVEYHRCEYPLASAQQKIRDAGLPGALASRLAEGR